MARLTPEHDVLVIRLVYDGPPRSGKTTSLAALADGMASAIFSPAEQNGRTLYFDWLEYVGGSFEGIPIRCQVVSVPGQPELASRRFSLLAEADAIVFVTHSTPEHLPGAAAHLLELREFLAAQPSPRPGVVVQANHRDLPDALSVAALRSELGLEGLALVESVATENQGIRQAFVLSVRLALDRARELKEQGSLPSGPGETDDPGALLARLQIAETAPVPPLRMPLPTEAVEEGGGTPAPPTAAGGSPQAPFLPDSSTPSGRVWPPIDGRIVLHSAAAPGAVPRCGLDGSWRFSVGAWHFHSAPRHEFDQLDDAKQELLRWAQRHAEGFDRLSPQRCLALADTGWGTWRLWQVVRAEESLRQRLRAALQDSAAIGAAQILRTCATRLFAARSSFNLSPPLPCRLELIGEEGDRPIYIGLLPPTGWEPPAAERSLADAALVRRELQPLVEAAGPHPSIVEDALQDLLAGS